MASSCTASWMGVSGFLISWARRRATSCQADTFCRYSRRRAGVPQLLDHAVEGPGQVVQLVAAGGRQPHRQIARAHPLGGVAQPGQPLGGPPGEVQPDQAAPPPAGPPRTPGSRACSWATVASKTCSRWCSRSSARVSSMKRSYISSGMPKVSSSVWLGCRSPGTGSRQRRAPRASRACTSGAASQTSPRPPSRPPAAGPAAGRRSRPGRPCGSGWVAASARVRRRNSSLRSMK